MPPSLLTFWGDVAFSLFALEVYAVKCKEEVLGLSVLHTSRAHIL